MRPQFWREGHHSTPCWQACREEFRVEVRVGVRTRVKVGSRVSIWISVRIGLGTGLRSRLGHFLGALMSLGLSTIVFNSVVCIHQVFSPNNCEQHSILISTPHIPMLGQTTGHGVVVHGIFDIFVTLFLYNNMVGA